MSGRPDEEFNPWRWDQDNARTGQAVLTIERHGHTVSLDHRGLSIDGHRVIRDDPSKGDEHGFQVTEQGAVLYRGQEVASLTPAPPGTSNPGEVTVWGPGGPTLPERRKRELDSRQQREEADRRSRDDRYRSSQQHQQELTHGQEMSL